MTVTYWKQGQTFKCFVHGEEFEFFACALSESVWIVPGTAELN